MEHSREPGPGRGGGGELQSVVDGDVDQARIDFVSTNAGTARGPSMTEHGHVQESITHSWKRDVPENRRCSVAEKLGRSHLCGVGASTASNVSADAFGWVALDRIR